MGNNHQGGVASKRRVPRTTRFKLRQLLFLLAAAFLAIAEAGPAQAQGDLTAEGLAARLAAAYPAQIRRVDGTGVAWNDGTRITIEDGEPEKSHADRLARPSLRDMFFDPYPLGPLRQVPAINADPGRYRPAAFFDKMYGNCRKNEVERHLEAVDWLPQYGGGKLRLTRLNGVADRARAISRELEQLPGTFRHFMVPAAGGYNCRPIAGTSQSSAHGYGIAIDIAVATADYWRWQLPASGPQIAYRNRIPDEIVQVFERHGFIWGGKWYHYDTMHFEFRPELLPPK